MWVGAAWTLRAVVSHTRLRGCMWVGAAGTVSRGGSGGLRRSGSGSLAVAGISRAAWSSRARMLSHFGIRFTKQTATPTAALAAGAPISGHGLRSRFVGGVLLTACCNLHVHPRGLCSQSRHSISELGCSFADSVAGSSFAFENANLCAPLYAPIECSLQARHTNSPVSIRCQLFANRHYCFRQRKAACVYSLHHVLSAGLHSWHIKQ